MRTLSYGSLATAAAILLAFAIVPGSSRVMALDEPLQKAVAAETIRFRVHTVSSGGQIETDETQSVVVHGKKIRIDPSKEHLLGLTYVIDHELKGMLFLSHQDKTYQTVDLSAKSGIMPFDAMSMNFREQIQQLRKQNATLAGKDVIDGKSVSKMTVDNGKAVGLTANWKVWFDPKTQYPVKLESVMTSPIWKSPTEKSNEERTTTRTYDRFEWNVKVAGESFSLDPPADYTEREIIQTIPPLTPIRKK